MSATYPIDVSPNGSVLLGSAVSCDGFHYGRPYRVQTHVHWDHLNDFETSKGIQRIFMSDASKALLEAELNADIPYRDNIVSVALGRPIALNGCEIELRRSGHMLGAVQVAVRPYDGPSLGYSGDFQWPLPLDEVIKVEALVLDSTCGALEQQPAYTQEEADAALVHEVLKALKSGPVFLAAHRGTLQRAVRLLGGLTDAPLIAKPNICRQIEVYRRCGYDIDPINPVTSETAQSAMREGRFIRLFSLAESLPVYENATQITLTKYMVPPEYPIIEFSPKVVRIGMSEHADVEGTLQYVEAVAPKFVLCDASRGGHAEHLAALIKSRLNINAAPSMRRPSYKWGD
jgi:putative mRNA 3-end processing factor